MQFLISENMMNEPQWVQFLTSKDKDEMDQDLVALTLRIEALEEQLDMVWTAFAEAAVQGSAHQSNPKGEQDMNTEQAWAIAADLAQNGKPVTKKIFELLEACCEVVESAKGFNALVSQARDSEEICGQILDGFLNDLMPAIVKAVDGDKRTLDSYFGFEDKPGNHE